MNYRITLADSVYYTRDELAAAQSEALDHARELTRVVGRPVRVTVHKMGQLVMDEFGRDVTPALFVGSAVGRLERSNAFKSWVPASRRLAVSAKGGSICQRVKAS